MTNSVEYLLGKRLGAALTRRLRVDMSSVSRRPRFEEISCRDIEGPAQPHHQLSIDPVGAGLEIEERRLGNPERRREVKGRQAARLPLPADALADDAVD